jgi:hypothetical protein
MDTLKPRNNYLRGRLRLDLLVLISIDKLLFILQRLSNFVTKQANLIMGSTVLSLSLQLELPEWSDSPCMVKKVYY